MGLLNRSDAKIFRGYFKEMCKLIGISVLYQYVEKQELTIHGEDNSKLSMPIRINLLFDEDPTIDTLNKLGWVVELNDQKPIVVNLPYDTPNLAVNSRIIVETIKGIDRPRVFKITTIKSDLEYPDAFTCIIVPVYDQIPQRNDYTLINNEKINTEVSERTPQGLPSSYITGTQNVDNTSSQNKEWHDKYVFIDDRKSPYSG